MLIRHWNKIANHYRLNGSRFVRGRISPSVVGIQAGQSVGVFTGDSERGFGFDPIRGRGFCKIEVIHERLSATFLSTLWSIQVSRETGLFSHSRLIFVRKSTTCEYSISYAVVCRHSVGQCARDDASSWLWFIGSCVLLFWRERRRDRS